MVTGLEPLLGPAVTKAAGAGAARLAGWGAKEIMGERRRRKIRALTHSRARADQLEALADLPADQMNRIKNFCESTNIEHIAGALSRAYLLEGAGKSSENFFQSVRAEFDASLAVWLGDDAPALVSEAIFAALTESVAKTVAPLLARPKLAPSLEAELIATSGSCATASMRNAELLRGISDLADMRVFEADYRSAVAAMFKNMRLPHAGTAKHVPYRDLFVQPMIKLDSDAAGPERYTDESIHIEDLLGHTPRLVLLGDPGGGKSTLSRKLTSDLANNQLPQLNNRVPLFLELRHYASAVRGKNRRTLVQQLEEACKSPYNLHAPKDAIEYLLLNDKAIVILDGLDELLDVSLRQSVVDAVQGFAHRYPTCPMLVTSRRVGYAEAALDDDLFERVSLSAFHQRQVKDYVNKWFTLDERVDHVNKKDLADSFIIDSEFVADLRINPLMLSLMCGIYASENYIPRNRPEVYEKCALLLFEKWDKQRGITPELSFDAHVQSALRALALHIFEKESASDTSGEIAGPQPDEGMAKSELIRFFSQYLRKKRFDNDEDAENAAVEFLDFCKGRAWVLTDVGAETYGFTHRTFLEYFAASQLVRLHTSASSLHEKLRDKIRAGESDVVAQLAVQILGKTAEDGADDFLHLLIQDASGSSTQDAYAVSFSARALTFIVPRPQVLKDICSHAVRLRLNPPDNHDENDAATMRRRQDAIDDLFRCSTENAPRVANALSDILDRAFETNDVSERTLALAFMQRTPGVRPSGHLAAWRKNNIEKYAGVIERYRDQFYWLAILELENGKISTSQLLDMHGVESMYERRVAGTIGTLPLMYRLLRRFERRKSVALAGGYMSAAQADAIVTDLIKLLPRQPRPWVTDAAHEVPAPIMLGSMRKEKSRISQCRTLFGLPALEVLEEEEEAPRLPLTTHSGQLLAARRGDGKLPSDVAELFEGEAAALKFLTRWTSKSIHLIGATSKEGASLHFYD